MSLDGYIAGPNDGPDNPGGDGFSRLHDWMDASEIAQKSLDEYSATGAVLAGRNTVEQVDHYEGNHHDVPMWSSATGRRLHRSPAIRQ
jgi:hypothetical protein